MRLGKHLEQNDNENNKPKIIIIIIQTIMISMIMLTADKNPLNQGEKKFDENNTISSHVL